MSLVRSPVHNMKSAIATGTDQLVMDVISFLGVPLLRMVPIAAPLRIRGTAAGAATGTLHRVHLMLLPDDIRRAVDVVHVPVLCSEHPRLPSDRNVKVSYRRNPCHTHGPIVIDTVMGLSFCRGVTRRTRPYVPRPTLQTPQFMYCRTTCPVARKTQSCLEQKWQKSAMSSSGRLRWSEQIVSSSDR